LKLRQNDKPELVEAVLSGRENEPARSITVLLIIVYRLRNNLFHGHKWAYDLRGQLQNFTHANATLMKALEVNGV